MRLLLDENLPEALVAALADVFPGSLHVRTLGATGASDENVWALARQHGCVLTTRDEDFLRLSVLRGPPPKVLWLGIGNCTTAELISLLRRRAADIQQFAEQDEAAFLALGR